MRRWILSGCLVGACGGGGGGGGGAPDAASIDATTTRTVQLTGHITSVDDQGGATPVNPGDSFTGSYTYEVGVADSNSDPTVGHYQFTAAGEGLHITIGGDTYESDPDAPLMFAIEVIDRDAALNGDAYSASSYTNRQTMGVYVENMGIGLTDLTGAALDSDALPDGAPTLAAWPQGGTVLIDGCDPAPTPPDDCGISGNQPYVFNGAIDTVQ